MAELVFEQAPFPHVVADDVLTQDVYADILRHWPSSSTFTTDPHRTMRIMQFAEKFGEFSDEQKRFWAGFFDGPYRQILLRIRQIFAPWLDARFDGVIPPMHFDGLMLMEVDQSTDTGANWGFPLHLHYPHDPLWMFTCLIYIDGTEGMTSGTTLYRPVESPEADLTRAARAAVHWKWYEIEDSELVVDREIAFRRNRLFAMLDGPLSFHAANMSPEEADRQTTRRILRAHVAAPVDYVEKIYGCDLDEIRARFRNGEGLDLVESDIRFFNAPRTPDRGSAVDAEINGFPS